MPRSRNVDPADRLLRHRALRSAPSIPDWQAFSTRLSRHRPEHLAIGSHRRAVGRRHDLRAWRCRRTRPALAIASARTARRSTASSTGERGLREAENVVDLGVEDVDARDHRVHHRAVASHQSRPATAGPATSRARPQAGCAPRARPPPRAGRVAPGACSASLVSASFRCVMSLRIARYCRGLPRGIEKRHDRGVDPVVAAVLGAIADLATPDLPLRDRPPQVPDEFLRVIAGVDDAVILADQLLRANTWRSRRTCRSRR